MSRVVVIGGGPAGVTAALRARELGAQVALVEQGRLGGTCTNDGCVPTRVLAKAARLMRDSESFGTYGLETEPPQVNLQRLLARAQQVVYGLHEKKQLRGHLERAGVEVHTEVGRAAFVDAHTLALGDGRRLVGDAFILCTGGHGRQVSFPGSERALTYRDVWTMARLPGSIAIVGAAHTGCQLASIFASFGSTVSLLEIGPRILGREDDLVSEALTDSMRQRGIRVLTGIAELSAIEGAPAGLRLRFGPPQAPDEVQAEAVLLAVGWAGAIDGLGLQAVGVQVERGYVAVNDYFQTSVEHIFAAGDVTGRMMLVQSGGHEGKIAAENAVLGVGQPYRHQIVPHGGFTDPEYASVGLTEAQARAAEPGCITAVVPYADIDRAVIDDLREGACKLVVSAENHRILGAHVVGEQALEIVQLVAAGMAADMWVEQLAELELAYPTYTAIIGLAARRAVHALGVMPLAPQWSALSGLHLTEWERRDPYQA